MQDVLIRDVSGYNGKPDLWVRVKDVQLAIWELKKVMEIYE